MIRSVFEAAAMAHSEMHNPKSRAMYGVGVTLDSSFQPKLLEGTYCPDCIRACKYDMEFVVGEGGIAKGCDFFNDVFRSLFERDVTCQPAVVCNLARENFILMIILYSQSMLFTGRRL